MTVWDYTYIQAIATSKGNGIYFTGWVLVFGFGFRFWSGLLIFMYEIGVKKNVIMDSIITPHCVSITCNPFPK